MKYMRLKSTYCRHLVKSLPSLSLTAAFVFLCRRNVHYNGRWARKSIAIRKSAVPYTKSTALSTNSTAKICVYSLDFSSNRK